MTTAATNALTRNSSLLENVNYEHHIPRRQQHHSLTSSLTAHSSEHVAVIVTTSSGAETALTAARDDKSDLDSIYEEETSMERSLTCTPELPPRTEEMLHIVSEDGVSCGSLNITPPPPLPPPPPPSVPHISDDITCETDHKITEASDHVVSETEQVICVSGDILLAIDSSPQHLPLDEVTSVSSYKIMIPAKLQDSEAASEPPVDQLSGQVLNSTKEAEDKEKENAGTLQTSILPPFQQPLTSAVLTQEEQGPPPRPPRPSPTRPGMRPAGVNSPVAIVRQSHRPPPPSLPSSTKRPHRLPPPLPQDSLTPTTPSLDAIKKPPPLSPQHTHSLSPPIPQATSTSSLDPHKPSPPPVPLSPQPHRDQPQVPAGASLHTSRPPPIPLPANSPPTSSARGKLSRTLPLPPRNIKRYPTSSSGSNSSNGGSVRVTLEEGAGEEYEDVFMRFNESYHSLRYLNTDKFNFF